MTRREKFMRIFRVASGNCLEMFDFTLYGYYAAYIGATFFPSETQTAALLKAFMAFGVGFLARPIGAIILGAYTDKVGRKKGLIRTLELMAIATLIMVITPSYYQIGMLAPILILFSRFLQGISAGAELGSTSVYLAEIAGPNNRGFYVSWQSASQQVAVVFASFLGVMIHSFLSPETIAAWAWRIPFIIGCLIIPLLFYLRSNLAETERFEKKKQHLTIKQIMASLGKNYKLILTAMCAVGLTNSCFYLITVYTPTFANKELHLSALASFAITLFVGVSNFLWLPIMAILGDKIGRKPILTITPIVFIVTAYPLMLWLASSPSFARLILVELWLSFLFASYNSALTTALTEIVPSEIRASGFSVAYSLSTAIFGGSTPLICTKLIDVAKNHLPESSVWLANSMPGIWISCIAIISFIAINIIYYKKEYSFE